MNLPCPVTMKEPSFCAAGEKLLVEQDALDFVRDRLPDQEPYHAWTNFEFIADGGSVNEVDLMILAPGGFYLIEIKSRPGVIEGDAHAWTWRDQGQEHVVDNLLLLVNRKAKRLLSPLRQQRAIGRMKLPFLEPLVFCSSPGLKVRPHTRSGSCTVRWDRKAFWSSTRTRRTAGCRSSTGRRGHERRSRPAGR